MASYAHVIKVLAAVYCADGKAMRGPLRGRLQNFQRLGLPLGLQVGKGKKIDYLDEQFYQIAFALELADAGIMPSQIVRIINTLWKIRLYGYFKDAVGNRDDDTILIFGLNQMSSLWNRDKLAAGDYYFAAVRGNNETLGNTIKNFALEGWRHLALINVSEIIRSLEKYRAIVPD